MTANIVPIARNQQVQQLYKISVMACHLKWSAVFPTASWVLEGTGNLLPGSWVWQDLMVLTSATFAIPQSKILKRANRTDPGTSTHFSQRTFQSISSDNEKFMHDGSVKSKANQLHNWKQTDLPNSWSCSWFTVLYAAAFVSRSWKTSTGPR